MFVIKGCARCGTEFFGHPEHEEENCPNCGAMTVHTSGEFLELRPLSLKQELDALLHELSTLKSRLAKFEAHICQIGDKYGQVQKDEKDRENERGEEVPSQEDR